MAILSESERQRGWLDKASVRRSCTL